MPAQLLQKDPRGAPGQLLSVWLQGIIAAAAMLHAGVTASSVGCSCKCSAPTSSGFDVTCANIPSMRFEVLLYTSEASKRPFALMEGSTAGLKQHVSVSFHGLLLAGTSYWVRAAAHNNSHGGADISRGWLSPCTSTPVICATHAGIAATVAHVLPPAAPGFETVDMYRMTELWGLPKNSSNNVSPSAVVDFLPSHDSADVFGAAWLYTLSNGFPAGRNPESGKPSGASGPLAFSPLSGAPIAKYSVQVSLMTKSKEFPSGYARYVSCQSTQPPQCFCTSACDRLIGYEAATEVYRDCHRDAEGHQHGCNCTPSEPPQLFGPPYPESASHVGRLPIYDLPPTQTFPYKQVPAGVTRKGWWFSTPIAGRCNTTQALQISQGNGQIAESRRQDADDDAASCSWRPSQFVTMVWADDLKRAGYDFSPIGCAVWVCLPGEAAAAARMIARNAVALADAFAALPVASSSPDVTSSAL